MSNESSANGFNVRAVVAVIQEDGKFLCIKRAEGIRASGKICFPGGGIEAAESELEALVRELHEELGVGILPDKKIWQSVTPWGVEVHWYKASLVESNFQLDPKEVVWCRWFTMQQLVDHEDLLVSNLQFFEALDRGEFSLD